jgi:tetratricopeptide (TPR) repeat protein
MMAAGWMLAPTPHFLVYSDAGAEATRELAASFERLHSFFARQTGIVPRNGLVRIIAFATADEFAQYRTRPGSDAFFIGITGGDYIVMPAGTRGDLRTAAHEYAHLLVHSTGWRLPPWLAEGISEVASTLHMSERGSFIGGNKAGRVQTLKGAPWIPLPQLFARPPNQDQLFYAQSWALTDLLLFAPKYAGRFSAFLAASASGSATEHALADVYFTSVETLTRDLRARIASDHPAIALPGFGAETAAIQLEPTDGRALLEGLHGTLAFEKGDFATAAAAWKRAIDLGITDAGLCYRYAVLADDRAALERTLVLDPAFDDARYKLALLEKNSGHAEQAVAHLRAMHHIASERVFDYWTVMADALLDLGRRAEAKQAAATAEAVASNDDEKKRAAQLAWLADTELAVEFDGSVARAVRVPVEGPARNPFIEPGDHARSTEATLEEVECDTGVKVRLRAQKLPLELSVPDLTRVQIRNAGGSAFELTCGPQQGRKVLVEYTSSGVLRGLELR